MRRIFLLLRDLLLLCCLSLAPQNGVLPARAGPPLSLSYNELPRSARVTEALDEDSKLTLTVHLNQEDGILTALLLRRKETASATSRLPEGFAEGLELVVNGTVQRLKVRTGALHLGLAQLPVSSRNQAMRIEVRFHGRAVLGLLIDPSTKTLRHLFPPRRLATFHLRAFSLPGRSGQANLEEWKALPVFVEPLALDGPAIDLHTHFAAALRAEDLFRIGIRHRTPYPVALLKRLGLSFDEGAIELINGLPSVRLAPAVVWNEARGSERIRSFQQCLEIEPFETIPFEQLESIFEARAPLAKHLPAFKDHLEALARDLNEQGVKYVELSLANILDPKWLEVAERVLEELERRYKVKIRFLAGLWRHESENQNLKLIERTAEVMRSSPYVVGVDFMGHETNPTSDIAAQIRAAARLRQEHPHMVVRVHAGENSLHPGNLLEAIQAGASRIGHGVYGVTDEVLGEARERGVIIEINLSSNLSLNHVDSATAVLIKRYLEAGVRVTLSTDGHGLYGTLGTPRWRPRGARG